MGYEIIVGFDASDEDVAESFLNNLADMIINEDDFPESTVRMRYVEDEEIDTNTA